MSDSELVHIILKWLRSHGAGTAKTIATALDVNKCEVNSQLYKHSPHLFTKVTSNLWMASKMYKASLRSTVKTKRRLNRNAPYPWIPTIKKKDSRRRKVAKATIVTEAWLERQSTHRCPQCHSLIALDSVKFATCFTFGFDSLEIEAYQ